MRVEYDKQTDDWLLQQYVLSRNQEAFAVLVRRYGPMVWGVCRRIVRQTQDAEDALQATFAVLARKARSIRRQRTIGAWLHQVARRIALRARATSNRREVAMPLAVSDAAVEPVVSQAGCDQTEVLDDEIARLPSLLRLPIILCYLEGLTNREAAERLGCPEGTIVSRLARGRDKLRLGLIRRGVVLGGTAAVASLLAESASAAPLLPELSQAALACGLLPGTGPMTGGAILSAGAARLAAEALQALARRTLLGYAALIACGALGIAAAVALALSLGVPLDGRLVQNDALGQAAGRGAGVPVLSLEGVWQGEELEFIGGDTPAEHAALSQDCRWVVAARSIRFKWQDVTIFSADFQVDSARQPNAIDIQPADDPAAPDSAVLRGVFSLNQSALDVCTAETEGERPKFVRAGIVAPAAAIETAVRAGLVGYSRLRRLARSVEADDLQGKWVAEHIEAGGEDWPIDAQGRDGARFDNGTYQLGMVQGENFVELGGTFELDPAQPARFMEMRPNQQQSFHCLYEIEGDTLRLAFAAPGAARPEKFKTEPGQLHMSLVFRRAKPTGPDGSQSRPP